MSANADRLVVADLIVGLIIVMLIPVGRFTYA